MTSSNPQNSWPDGRPPARRPRDRTPPGHRVLHVVVPEKTFNHVKAQAYLSDMPFPQYIALSLADCGVRRAGGQVPEQANADPGSLVTSSATAGQP